MKTIAFLLVLLVFLAGCVSNSSDNKVLDKNSPPPLPDENDAATTADNNVPSAPNPQTSEPQVPSSNNPPSVPA